VGGPAMQAGLPDIFVLPGLRGGGQRLHARQHHLDICVRSPSSTLGFGRSAALCDSTQPRAVLHPNCRQTRHSAAAESRSSQRFQ